MKYCASNQVGDAVLLYAAVFGPLWDEVRKKPGGGSEAMMGRAKNFIVAVAPRRLIHPARLRLGGRGRLPAVCVCHVLGWREYTAFLSGSAPAGERADLCLALGIVYAVAYFGFVLVAPFFSWRRGSSPCCCAPGERIARVNNCRPEQASQFRHSRRPCRFLPELRRLVPAYTGLHSSVCTSISPRGKIMRLAWATNIHLNFLTTTARR